MNEKKFENLIINNAATLLKLDRTTRTIEFIKIL